jgi:hypothetical protein
MIIATGPGCAIPGLLAAPSVDPATVRRNKRAACHQLAGLGLPGLFPRSIGGVAYVTPMPAFADQLSDEGSGNSSGNQSPRSRGKACTLDADVMRTGHARDL